MPKGSSYTLSLRVRTYGVEMSVAVFRPPPCAEFGPVEVEAPCKLM